MSRDREQPAAQVRPIPAVLEMPQELEERLLHAVFGVFGAMKQDQGEAVDRRAMRLEQVPGRIGRALSRFHVNDRHRV